MADETMWFVGVDWGSAEHQACLLDAAGKVLGERDFAHGGAGLAALCDWLVSTRAKAGAVAVAIEVPHGPVVEALLGARLRGLSINPKQLDRFRDRFSVAGAKDDRRDARVARRRAAHGRALFRPRAPATRSWSSCASGRAWPRSSSGERERLGNRVRQQLWRYYPQVLELSDDVAAEWFLALGDGADAGAGGAPARGDRGAPAPAAPHPPAHAATGARHPPQPRSPWLPASPRRPTCHLAPSRPGCAWSTGAPPGRRASSTSSAAAPERTRTGADRGAARRGDPPLPARRRPDHPRHLLAEAAGPLARRDYRPQDPLRAWRP